MIRLPFLSVLSILMLLGSSCSKRDKTDLNAEANSGIETAAVTESASAAAPVAAVAETAADDANPDGEFDGFIERLERMKSIERGPGQTMLSGDSLVFDYRARFVRMDGDVLVDDENGQLRTETLIGRFSGSNRVEYIEAEGGVSIDSDGRKAHADRATYNYLDGTVQLDGQAVLSESGNSLEGEQIRFWIKGDRKMICEPNALLIVAGRGGLAMEDLPEEVGDTEIRANRIVYDDANQRVDLVGRVRLRNAQVAMNCGEIHLFLKDDRKIDWIEAVNGVIIQSEGREALADRAVYDAGEGKFTLEGSPPMVKQGRNVMTGDRIVFWHKTRTVLCEPNGRVLYYYDLDEKTQALFPKDLND